MPFANEDDRRYFENRLATYGLSTSAMIAEKLTTTPSVVTSLSLEATSMYRPIVRKTSDFDQVNAWLGVPDEVFNNAAPAVEPPRRLNLPGIEMRRFQPLAPSAEVMANFSKADLTAEQLGDVRTVARAYLLGDSRQLKAYKSWIEKVFPEITIPIWLFQDVTVTSGSVLEFGPGPHVLLAHNLTVEAGGVIRCYGNLKVDVTVLQKTVPIRFVPIDKVLLRPTFRRAGLG